MKIATYNINGIRARFDTVIAWLSEQAPDVALLQEIKIVDEAFPREEIERLGYRVATHGQKGFNGVAILSKLPLEDVIRGLPGDESDEQARWIEATVMGERRAVRVCCLYLPNGNPQPGPKFDYKLAWFERLITRAAQLLETGAPVVMAGDYNVMPTEMDVYKPERWRDDALFHPEVRRAFADLIAQGWTDAVRALHPDEKIYTFWDYFRNAFARDAGLRIDHFLLSPPVTPWLRSAAVRKAPRAWEHTSDHTPVIIELDVPTL